jgi:hypothetical protein
MHGYFWTGSLFGDRMVAYGVTNNPRQSGLMVVICNHTYKVLNMMKNWTRLGATES